MKFFSSHYIKSPKILFIFVCFLHAFLEGKGKESPKNHQRISWFNIGQAQTKNPGNQWDKKHPKYHFLDNSYLIDFQGFTFFLIHSTYNILIYNYLSINFK